MLYQVKQMPDEVADQNRTAAEILERACLGGMLKNGVLFTWEENILYAAQYFAEIQDGRFAPEIPGALLVVRQYLVPVEE